MKCVNGLYLIRFIHYICLVILQLLIVNFNCSKWNAHGSKELREEIKTCLMMIKPTKAQIRFSPCKFPMIKIFFLK